MYWQLIRFWRRPEVAAAIEKAVVVGIVVAGVSRAVSHQRTRRP